MTAQMFVFDFDRAYRRAGRPFGVSPQRSAIRVEDGELSVRFGPWSIRTPLTNIASTQITGPYAFLKTAGPAHLGLTDRGLTFATNGRRGLELTFHEPITGIEPLGVIHHPNLTVTPAEVEALQQALTPSVT